MTGVFDFVLPGGVEIGFFEVDTDGATGIERPSVGSSGAKGGFGGAIFIFVLGNTTEAVIESGVHLYNGLDGGFTLTASEKIVAFSFSQSGAKSGSFAVSGTFTYFGQDSETLAHLDSGAVVTGRSVSVFAGSLETVANWAGGITKGESIGVGVSVAVNDLDRRTRAIVGSRDLDSRGAETVTIDVAEGVSVTAATLGEVIALTVAAAVVGNEDQEMGGDTPDDQLDGVSTPSTFDEAQPQSQTKAQTGIGFAGAVSVNLLRDVIVAAVNDDGTITAESLTVEARDRTGLVAITGGGSFLSGAGTGTSAAIAGAFSYSEVDRTLRAVVLGTTLALTGDLVVSARRDARIIAASVGGAGNTTSKGIAVAGSVSVNRLLGTTDARLEDVDAVVGGAASIVAQGSGGIIAIGGGLSYGTRVGLGAALGFNQITNQTSAAVLAVATRPSMVVGGDLTVAASEDIALRSIAVSAGVSKGVGGAFTIAINLVDDDVEARLAGIDLDGPASVAVTARDDVVLQAVGGALGIGLDKAGFGAALGWNQVGSDASAAISDVVMTGVAGDVTVAAVSSEQDVLLDGKIFAVSVAGAGSSETAVAGALSINVVTGDVRAAVAGSAITAGGALEVSAANDATIRALTGGGAVAAGGSAAVGVAIGVNVLVGRVVASVADTAVVVGGAVDVTAATAATIETITIGLAVAVKGGDRSTGQTNPPEAPAAPGAETPGGAPAGATTGGGGAASTFSLTGAGSISINVVRGDTVASIVDSTVDSGGLVTVRATDATTIHAIAGAIALTIGGDGGAAVGVSIAVNDVRHATRAIVQDTPVVATGLVVEADSSAEVIVLALAGSGNVETGSGSDLRVTGAGAIAVNLVSTIVEAVVRGASPVTAVAGDIEVVAADATTIIADAGAVAIQLSGGSGRSVTVGAAVGANDVTTVVHAGVEVVPATVVSATGDLTVSTTTATTITTLSLGVAGAVTTGSGGGASFAGAGSGSGNSIHTTSAATVAGAVVQVGSGVSVNAVDSSTIVADAGAVGLVLARGPPLAISASIAVNLIVTDVRAVVRDSQVEASSISIGASTNSSIIALAIAGGGTASSGSEGTGFSLNGAGAVTVNTITTSVSAAALQSALVSATTVAVTATDTSQIIADAGGVAVTVASQQSGGASVTIGAAVAVNEVAVDVVAEVTDTPVVAPTGLTVVATSSTVVNALAIGVAGAVSSGGSGVTAGLAGAGSGVGNTASGVTTASVSASPVTTGGPVAVTATDATSLVGTAGAIAIQVTTGGSGTGGGAAIGAGVVVATIDRDVTALVDGSALGSAGAPVASVDVVATSTAAVVSTGFAGAVGVATSSGGGAFAFGGAAAVSVNTVDIDVLAA
ncbi:MAG TPA: hypothetical protein VJ978_03530, partial [Nitriliruptoraceae bacterium]|nr:hypothetical protein [Nitriliruptoraceae bacterium]